MFLMPPPNCLGGGRRPARPAGGVERGSAGIFFRRFHVLVFLMRARMQKEAVLADSQNRCRPPPQPSPKTTGRGKFGQRKKLSPLLLWLAVAPAVRGGGVAL